MLLLGMRSLVGTVTFDLRPLHKPNATWETPDCRHGNPFVFLVFIYLFMAFTYNLLFL